MKAEECDDGNLLGDDGCTAECTRGFGDGRDGELALDSPVAIPSVRSLCQGAAGDRNLSFDGNAVFEAGMTLLIHQSQAAEGEVGHFEYAELARDERTSAHPRRALAAQLFEWRWCPLSGHRSQTIHPGSNRRRRPTRSACLEWSNRWYFSRRRRRRPVVRENGTLSAEGAGFRGQGHGGGTAVLGAIPVKVTEVALAMWTSSPVAAVAVAEAAVKTMHQAGVVVMLKQATRAMRAVVAPAVEACPSRVAVQVLRPMMI